MADISRTIGGLSVLKVSFMGFPEAQQILDDAIGLLKETMDGGMTLNEYQKLAARTIPETMGAVGMTNHALHGMASEVGELHGIHQKVYQGHSLDLDHAKKECGDQMWFLAEYCTAHDWKLSDVAAMNIGKLMARYPDGFSEERSLHRAEGDV